MRIKAKRMALRVLAAFRSCFFSVLFLAFFLPWPTAVVTAKAVEARDGVVPDFSLPLINCLGTNLASRGNELISSALLRLSAGVVGTVREIPEEQLAVALEPFRPPFRPCCCCPLGTLLPLKCSESHRFIVLIKAGSGSDRSCWIEVRDLEDLFVFDFASLELELPELPELLLLFFPAPDAPNPELFASGNLMRIV